MLALIMQQMHRYAFIVRVVRCRVHKAYIIYVQVAIYILAKIHKKTRSTPCVYWILCLLDRASS